MAYQKVSSDSGLDMQSREKAVLLPKHWWVHTSNAPVSSQKVDHQKDVICMETYIHCLSNS